jgi:Rad3-related DNA helicase
VGALAGGLQACKEQDRCILYTARTYKELDRVVEELVAINRKEKVSGISIRGRSEMCVNDAVIRLSRDSRTLMELCSDLVESGKCPYYSNLCPIVNILHESMTFATSLIYSPNIRGGFSDKVTCGDKGIILYLPGFF